MSQENLYPAYLKAFAVTLSGTQIEDQNFHIKKGRFVEQHGESEYLAAALGVADARRAMGHTLPSSAIASKQEVISTVQKLLG